MFFYSLTWGDIFLKKRFLFILLIAVICFSSISAIHAMDINNDTLDNNVLVDSQNDDENISVEEEKPSTLVAPDIVKYYKNGTNFEAILKGRYTTSPS